MLMLMLDLSPQAEKAGVTHFGAYHRPPDGHFCYLYSILLDGTCPSVSDTFFDSEVGKRSFPLKMKANLFWQKASVKPPPLFGPHVHWGPADKGREDPGFYKLLCEE